MSFPSPTNATGQQSRTNNMSEDGRALVGWIVCSGNPICRGGRQGVMWDSTTGVFTDFSTILGAFVGEAYSANSDGSIVAGLNGGANNQPWIWRHDTGTVSLLPKVPIPGVTGGSSSFNSISEDGTSP